MSSIDNRIVNMQFDNAQFERGVAQTTQTLSNFNKSLNSMDGSTVDLGKLSSNVDAISDRFSFMGDLAFRAFGRIKESFLDLVFTIKNNVGFVVDPFAGMQDGFTEYESLINNTKAITVGAKMAQEDVEALLGRMNEYADQTVYNFGQMVDATKKFINAGVDAETSEKAIIGISNAAAHAGVESDKAGIAMFNFSQAMATGFLNQTDYRSINQAGFLTIRLKEQLADAAIAAGTLTREMDDVTGEYIYTSTTTNNLGKNFAGTFEQLFQGMQYQWASREVLLDVLTDYGDRTTEIGAAAYESATQLRTFSMFIDSTKEALGSGWAETWKLLVGNLQESTELWTAVGNSIGDFAKRSADARNEFLKTWKSLGGRDALLSGIAAGFQSIVAVLGIVKDGFRNIFPPTTAEDLANFTKGFQSFMEQMKPSEQTLERLERIFSGVAAAIDLALIPVQLLGQGLKFLFGVLSDESDGTESILDIVLEFIADIGDFVVAINNAVENATSFREMLSMLWEAVKTYFGQIGEYFENISSKWMRIFDDLFQNNEIFISIKAFGTSIVESLKTVFDFFEKSDVYNSIKSFGLKIIESLKSIFSFFKNNEIYNSVESFGISIINSIKSVFSDIKNFFTTENPIVEGLVNGLKTGITSVVTWITNIATIIIDKFKEILGIASPSKVFYEFGINIWEGFINGIKAIINRVYSFMTEIATKIAEAFNAAWLKASTFITNVGTSIVNGFNDARTAVRNFTGDLAKTDWSILDAIKRKFDEFNVEGTTFGNITRALQKFVSDNRPIIDWMKNTFGPIIDYLWSKLQLLNPANVAALLAGRGIHLGGRGIFGFLLEAGNLMKKLSEAIGPLVTGVTDVLKNFGGIAKSFSGIFDEVGNTLKAFQGKIKAEVLRSIAISVILLAAAMAGLSFIPWEKLKVGIAAISTVTVELVGAMQGLRGTGGLGGTIGTLIAISASILILSFALAKLANVNQNGIWNGIAAITVLMATLTGFVKVADGVTIQLSVLKLIGIAFAIDMLADSIVKLSAIKEWKALGIGLGGLAGAFASLFFFVKFIDGPKLVKLGSSFIMLAIGMRILAGAISTYAKMDWEFLGLGLLKLGGSLVVIGWAMRAFPTDTHARLIGVAVGMTAMIVPIAILGHMNFGTLAKGIIALGLGLALIGWALNIFPNNVSVKLIGLAVGMTMMTAPIAILGNMEIETLAKGIGALFSALVLLALALGLLKLFGLGGLSISSIAIGLVALSASLTLLIVPITLLGIMPISIISQGLQTLAYGLTILIVALALLPDFGRILGVAGGLVVLTGALTVFGAAIILFGLFSWDTIVGGLVVFASALLMVMAAAWLLPDPNRMIMTAVGILAIAAALTGLVIPAGLLSKIGWDQLKVGLGGLAALLIMVGIAAYVLEGPMLMTCALGLGAMALAMTALTIPVLLLSRLTWEELSNSLRAFIIILGLSGLAALGIYFCAGAMVVFGLGCLAVGAGVYIAAKGVEILFDLFARFAKAVGPIIGQIVADFLNFGANIINAFIQGIKDFFGPLIDAVIWVCNGVIAAFKWAFKINSPSKVMRDEIGLYVMEGLDDGLKAGSGKVEQTIDGITRDLTDTFEEGLNPEQLKAKADELLGTNGLLGVVKENGTELKAEFDKMGLGVDEAFSGLLDGKLENFDISKISELTKGLNDGNLDIEGVLKELGGDLSTGAESGIPTDLFKQLGIDITGQNGVLGGVLSGKGDLNAEIANIGPNLFTTIDSSVKSEQYSPVGQKIIQGIINGITSMELALKAKIDSVIQLLSMGNEDQVGFSIFGENIVNGIILGINNTLPFLDIEVIKIGQSSIETLNTAFSVEVMMPVGQNIIDGLILGVKDKAAELTQTLVAMANAAIIAAKATLGINSPSKVFYEMGGYLDDGLALGIKDNAGVVGEASKQTGNVATNALRESLSNANFNQAVNLNPTITPVVDLSNVKKSSEEIPKMMNGATQKSNIKLQGVAKDLGQVRWSREKQLELGNESQIGDPRWSKQASASTVINNNFDVKNESDARTVSNKLATLVERNQYSRGKVAYA